MEIIAASIGQENNDLRKSRYSGMISDSRLSEAKRHGCIPAFV
jgi:hypothetical protein